ncbi:Uncharacterised protein [Vibrio cholerae]|nr:Uncharacterised protein [Vibrio cholerae]
MSELIDTHFAIGHVNTDRHSFLSGNFCRSPYP